MMIVPACKLCKYTDKKPEITGETDSDVLMIKIECLMCLFTTEDVIKKMCIRQEEIEEIVF